MELLIILAVVIGGIGWWIWKERRLEENGHPLETITQKIDLNKDGKVDAKDAEVAVEVVKEKVKSTGRKKKSDQESA